MWGHKSQLRKCELHVVTSFQEDSMKGRKGKSLTVGKPDKHYLIQVIKVNVSSAISDFF